MLVLAANTPYVLSYCIYLQWVRIQPTGLVHFKTKDDGYHYSWNKPHTTVHNLIIGSLWADHVSQCVCVRVLGRAELDGS